MRRVVEIHGLEPRQGETAFAFLVLRLARPMEREELVELMRYVAPVVPDADEIIEGFASELEEALKIVGMPWLPPEPGDLDEQRALIERTAARGVEAAWFFQTGTALPSEDEEDGEDGEDGEDDEDDDDDDTGTEEGAAGESSLAKLAASTDENWDELLVGDVTDPQTPLHHEGMRQSDEDEDDDDDEDDEDEDEDNDDEENEEDEVDEDEDDEDEDDEDDDEDEDEDDEDDDDAEDEVAQWSHGPPPQLTEVPFPVDGYPEILEELDWEDFGIAIKLAGPFTPGEGTVLLGFHALWLAPYGGERYRNAAVTIDRHHHAAHLWVDRFAVPCSPEEQVGHLLWILSKLHEVMPVVHARFGGATMGQKYGGMMGDTSTPFVLGGNPLLAVHAEGGESDVDLWIAEQTDWSSEEVAQMLRELAEQIVTSGDEDDQDDDELGDEGEADDDDDDEAGDEGEDDEGEADDDDDDEAGDEGEDEGEGDEGDVEDDDDGGRQITSFAGELLIARARAGLLEPRVVEALRPLLATAEQHEHRRTAVIGILGALRDRASVPSMIQILEENPIRNALDSIGKAELLAETATALGAIGDPSAAPALAKLVAAPGPHHDGPRRSAAVALASCLAGAPEPRDVDDAAINAMLEAIRERDDGELDAELHVAYGQLARQLPPSRRDDLRRRLVETDLSRDDDVARLARHAALVLASSDGRVDTGSAATMRPLLHAVLTGLGYDHAQTLRNLRIALRVAELLPELVAPADLIWLTRLPEPDVRERAHALLDRLHHGMSPARCFDERAARELSDAELIAQVGDPHVVGCAALVGEIARRDLRAARSAVRAVVQEVVDRAPPGDRYLLAPDTRLLELAIPWLRGGNLDDDTLALFDRILRHGNPHVKWALVQEPPDDDRLLGGMFYVFSEHWSWQETTARDWLRRREGTSAFEAARRRAGVASIDEDAEADEDGEDEGEEDEDDDEGDDDMN